MHEHFQNHQKVKFLKKKIENLKKNKLVYSNDGTDLEKKQKEINDLHMSIELKNGEFEQLKKNQQELEAKIANYEEDSKFWRSNYEKNQEFMEESKKLIETLQNERQNTAPETIYKSHETLRQKRPPLNSKTALNLHGDHSPDTSAMDSHGDYSFQDFPGHFEDNEEEYSLGILESSRGGKMSTNESLGSGSAKDEENFQYDKKKERSRNEINHKRVKEPREKAIKKKRTAGSEGFDDMSDIEEECEKKSRPKKFKKRFVRTKKYANFHSSSDSECNEKRTFTRGSDDEYEPENLRQSENHQNYKSYYAETGKKRHMYHLMCDISIKYKTWDTLKKIFDMKEWIRVLVHAMFKEEDLIGKTFNLAGCKIDRLPGITRSEFKREEKAAIRQTFFCRCDQVVKRRREAEMHKNNWKSYISEHINSLFMKEKAERAKIEKKQKIKAKATKEPQEQFSLSSDDS
ncbi:uncharacterized protein LOC131669241 [Phymastichus coffea]|uniref:uncharacterized protein LOC131669241 n=1 Tax=Phymastichus coffea TaxID=108790 RepID=UPI00273B7A1D|nr:uncharacterized protein LOC131669241 [Phymastichus coffea]XP_058799971.1 uncharacterized protein LOC131669241 [Phymastichus coffea]